MKGGSFFLADIQRTRSSLRPGGAVSASTSVTQPYWYSWLAAARSSAFVTSVDMPTPRLALRDRKAAIVPCFPNADGISGSYECQQLLTC